MRIYVAHTYGRRHGLSDKECERNAWKSIEVGRLLIMKGHNPFIPNLYHFVHKNWNKTLPDNLWLTLVSEWLHFCDALLVAEMPPWDGSGVQHEIDIANKLKLPIYYSIDDIPDG